MTAIDNDIFTQYVHGNHQIAARILAFPRGELALPVIVVEEILRGRLNKIQQTQARHGGDLTKANELLARSVVSIQQFRILAFSESATALVLEWRSLGIKVGTQDLRIAAICVTQNIRLISNNKSDFHRIPNLNLETWN